MPNTIKSTKLESIDARVCYFLKNLRASIEMGLFPGTSFLETSDGRVIHTAKAMAEIYNAHFLHSQDNLIRKNALQVLGNIAQTKKNVFKDRNFIFGLFSSLTREARTERIYEFFDSLQIYFQSNFDLEKITHDIEVFGSDIARLTPFFELNPSNHFSISCQRKLPLLLAHLSTLKTSYVFINKFEIFDSYFDRLNVEKICSFFFNFITATKTTLTDFTLKDVNLITYENIHSEQDSFDNPYQRNHSSHVVSYIARQFYRHVNIASLSFASNKLDDITVPIIEIALTCPNLQVLDLSHAQISEKSAKRMLTVLQEHCHNGLRIPKINLEGNESITAETMQAFVELHTPSQITPICSSSTNDLLPTQSSIPTYSPAARDILDEEYQHAYAVDAQIRKKPVLNQASSSTDTSSSTVMAPIVFPHVSFRH